MTPTDDQKGYDTGFLGLPAPVPRPGGAEVETLDYTHFTVLHRTDRKLAAVTAVNIHGGLLRDVERTDRWIFDPRLDSSLQAGNDLYRNNDFDRGHLVRRLDPVWGTDSEARGADADTFHFTNAAPQAAVFNQSKKLWAGLENYLLEHAATFDRRLSVCTGPLFADDDPEYRGVGIPRKFWKVAIWLQESTLSATAYLLDQTELVGDILAAETAAAPAPPLGAYRTFQVPVADVAALAGLEMPELIAADVMVQPDTGLAPGELAWRELTSTSDIRLGG